MTLPIKQVVVMEDRAQVERAGAVVLDGVTRVEVPGLPLVAVDRSLKVEVRGGTLLEAKLERRWRELPRDGLPADASELRRKYEALRLQVIEQTDQVAKLDNRATLLSAARTDLLRAIAQQTGHGAVEADGWRAQLDSLSQRQAALDQERHEAALQLAKTRRDAEETRAALATEAPVTKADCVLVLRLEGSGEAQVRVSYLVPCAVWRPAYRATLQGGQVQLEAEAVVWQHTGEDWRDVKLSFSTARPTLGTTPPRLMEDILSLRPKTTREKRVVDVVLREEVIQESGESSDEMPGLDDGGETRLLEASGPTTVRSDGQPQRVSLFSFTSPAMVEHVCPAELSQLVFVVARFTNAAKDVLLAGPVDLIRESGLVGRGQLKYAAPGETLKLSFGNEDGVQLIRDTEEKTDEAMLTGRRTRTRKIKLHVSNMRSQPIKLTIEERVPVSEVKEAEVTVLTKHCEPAPQETTKDGIVRIPVSVGAQSTLTARFAWELSASSKVAGV